MASFTNYNKPYPTNLDHDVALLISNPFIIQDTSTNALYHPLQCNLERILGSGILLVKLSENYIVAEPVDYPFPFTEYIYLI